MRVISFVHLIWVDCAYRPDHPQLFPEMTVHARLRYNSGSQAFRPVSDIATFLPFDVLGHPRMDPDAMPVPRPMHWSKLFGLRARVRADKIRDELEQNSSGRNVRRRT